MRTIIINNPGPQGPQGPSGQSYPQLERRSDFVTTTSYCGIAPLGSLETSQVWTISKIVVAENGNTTTTTATNVAWTDRFIVIYT